MLLVVLASSRFLFLPCFIVLCLWVLYEIHKSNKKNETIERQFWERERQANLLKKGYGEIKFPCKHRSVSDQTATETIH